MSAHVPSMKAKVLHECLSTQNRVRTTCNVMRKLRVTYLTETHNFRT